MFKRRLAAECIKGIQGVSHGRVADTATGPASVEAVDVEAEFHFERD